MPSLVESISYKILFAGLVFSISLIIGALMTDTLSLLVGLVSLEVFIVSLAGIQPLGETVAHRLIFFTNLTLIAFVGFYNQGAIVIPAIFGSLGLIGLALSVRHALSEGIWAPAKTDRKSY